MKYVAIDIETVGLKPFGGTLWIFSITEKKKTKLYHNCFGLKELPQEVMQILADEKICKIVHNGEFDLPYLEIALAGAWAEFCEKYPKSDLVFASKMRWDATTIPRLKIKNIWDTQLAETVIQGTQVRGTKDEQLRKQHGTALVNVLERYGFKAHSKSVRENFIARPLGTAFTKEELKYAGDDTKNLHVIQQAQEYLLTRDKGLEVALLENKVVEVVANMKVIGLGVDVEKWNFIADSNTALYQKQLKKLPPLENWNSPLQVKAFFNSRGIKINSFDELDELALATGDKTLNNFVKLRELYSSATAYGRKWLLDDKGNSVVDADGRIRTSWQQILNTGRFATSAPNILALPKDGLQRSSIVPAKGNLFVIGDYSGQEIGIIAAAAKDSTWIDTLLRGESVHSLIASILFPTEWQRGRERGCTFPKKCSCKRHQDLPGLPYWKAKKLNFMLAYGGGPGKYGQITGADQLTSRVTVAKYKRAIPKINAYLEHNAQLAVKNGVAYSADPYKRRIVLRGQEQWQIENQGKNYPIQSAGANMLKLAMISLPEEFPVVLPFHDELVLEVRAKDAPRAAKVMKQIMEQSAAYITGIDQLIKVQPRINNNFAKQ